MKNVCIFGWYGTETLGDRAILDGIFQIFNSVGNFKMQIGSLYQNFTKRTFLEDESIYKENSPKLEFEIFDVNNQMERKKRIKNSEIIIMGGGPIMDLEELKIIQKTFLYAKKHHKKTMLFGCGIGPLNQKKYIKITKNILKHSDMCIFRDEKSCNRANLIYRGNYTYSYDPAVISILNYAKNHTKKTSENYICINFRRITDEYNVQNDFDKSLVNIVKFSSTQYDKVLLVPMHTYGIGGDDRKLLTELCYKINQSNIQVLHKPMNLYELYELYANATACIGMRYHSIVMQTLLNGNNIIIDYTDKINGKIISFINQVDSEHFYKNRYINIKEEKDQLEVLHQLQEKNIFSSEQNLLENVFAFYKQRLETLLYGKK